MGCKICTNKASHKISIPPTVNTDKMSCLSCECEIPQESYPSLIKTSSPMILKRQLEKFIESHIALYLDSLSPFLLTSSDMLLDSGQLDHFYKEMTILHSSLPSSHAKFKRLISELKILKKNLPLNYTNSIFIQSNPSHLDLMKALIVGSEETPYANGVFLFDIYFDDNYPSTPPKMVLMTNGNNSIRFNPNLYSNGYICLSILGTWSGDSIEKWNGDRSTLLQILLSIQSLVMTEGVYFNEPGYSWDKNSSTAIALNRAYSNIVKYGTVKFAMNEMIMKKPKGFENIIKNHFVNKKKDIIKTCRKWLDQAKEDNGKCDYDGLVSSHNAILASKFKSEGGYYCMLSEEVGVLERLISKMESYEY